jgi:hypothetical protein
LLFIVRRATHEFSRLKIQKNNPFLPKEMEKLFLDLFFRMELKIYRRKAD